MSISKALQELYAERDRLDAERAQLDEAIVALEGIAAPSAANAKPKKKDGRSAPKPPVNCPFCGDTQKGMAGLAAHVRANHPDRYPESYEEWKASRV
ncbi:MAG: hypothetical protein ACR2N2_09395 [Acidimicrobiia bacterium]